MNEILSIVIFAYFAERLESDKDFDKMSTDEISKNPEILIEFVFDYRHTIADAYAAYNRILEFGVKKLYQETKDITTLRKEMISQDGSGEPKGLDKIALF